jgi:hypothetical protein
LRAANPGITNSAEIAAMPTRLINRSEMMIVGNFDVLVGDLEIKRRRNKPLRTDIGQQLLLRIFGGSTI